MRCFEDLPTSKQNTNFLFSQIAACVHTHYLPNGTSRRKPVLYKNPKRSSEYERKKFEREIGKKSHRFFSTTWSKKQVPWFYLVRWTQQVNRLVGSSTCRLNLAGESCPILPLQETTDNLCECLWSTVKILFCAGVSLFILLICNMELRENWEKCCFIELQLVRIDIFDYCGILEVFTPGHWPRVLPGRCRTWNELWMNLIFSPLWTLLSWQFLKKFLDIILI